MKDLTKLSDADLNVENDSADEALHSARARVRQIEDERARRLRAKQDSCPHTGWHTGHVCCPLCGVEDGC